MNRSLSILSVAAFSTFALMSTSALSATKIGIIGAADETVSIVSEEGVSRIVKLGDAIYADDTIKTNGNGKAQLIFEDRSTVTVNANSEIKIDEYIYNPNKSSGDMAIKSVKGAFRFIGGALSKKKHVKIKTPVATIGIRGGIVDTHVGEGGQTDAVFVFGDEMVMTDAQGQTHVTTDFGTGFSLQDTASVVQPLPANVVSQHLGTFMHKAGNGGGAPVVPQPEVMQEKMKLDTDSKQPMPANVPTSPTSGSAAPQSNATPPASSPQGQNSQDQVSPLQVTAEQEPAPIMMVGDSSVTAMDMASMMSSDAALNQMNDMMQSAFENPETLEAFITSDSFSEAGITADDNGSPAALPPVANVVQDDPQADTAIIDALEDEPADVVTNNNGGATTPPPAMVFTPVTGVAGRFFKLTDAENATIGQALPDAKKGDIVALEQSDTHFKITINDDGAGPDRTVIVQKPAAVGYNSGVVQTYTKDGDEIDRHIESYKSKFGGMYVYKTERSGVDMIETRDSNFVFGDAAVDGANTLADAAARSVGYTSSALAPVNTHGILAYDIIPEELANGDTSDTVFGAYKNDQKTLYIDWNDRNGEVGHVIEGYVGWLEQDYDGDGIDFRDTSVTEVTLGTVADGGMRFSYKAPLIGAYDSNDKGEFRGAAYEIGEDKIFGKLDPDSPVEGGIYQYATPTPDIMTGSQDLRVSTDIFGGAVDNIGANAFVLNDDVPSAEFLNAAVNRTEDTKTGFAAGIVLQYHNGLGGYKPKIFANQSEGDVSVTPTTDGKVSGYIILDDMNNLIGSSGDSLSASFTDTSSVYINDKLYGAQQSTVTHTSNSLTEADASRGFIVSGGLLNDNAQLHLPGAYKCNDCEFVNWGVWAGDVGKREFSNTQGDYANMIPYVVGEVSQNLVRDGVTADYKGEAYASVFTRDSMMNTITSNPENIVGTMDATVQFNGMTSHNLMDLKLEFANAPGGALDIRLDGVTPIYNSGAAEFVTPANLKNGGAGGPTLIDGIAQGALFGPNGEEIGGNYQFVKDLGGDDELHGAGIFFGKERP